MTEKIPCRLCLLRDIDPAEYETRIKRILDAMRPDERVSDLEYENRLSVCQACSYLYQGTCLSCGCFVELRAAAKMGHCAYRKW